MNYYFLKDDFVKLERKILEVINQVKEIGEKIGESCETGADTWHDNFEYEEGMRQMSMVSSHLKQLTDIRNKARVVTPNKSNDRVSIGKTVRVLINGLEESIYHIGSYIILDDPDEPAKQETNKNISYISPIAKLIINHSVGEVREGIIGHQNKKIKILSIE